MQEKLNFHDATVVKKYVERNNMKFGFYRNSKGVVRYLVGLSYLGPFLFVCYRNKTLALRNSSSTQAVNIMDSNVFEWFAEADYLGVDVKSAGLK